jgi:hypothetical protein
MTEGNKRMRVYITKYALTGGIKLVWGELFAEGRAVKYGKHFESAFGEGRQWHRTFEEAKKRAEEMREAKIASLRKAIAKLEKLEF